MTSDPFIVFTSNIFAILGLRSLLSIVASLIKLPKAGTTAIAEDARP